MLRKKRKWRNLNHHQSTHFLSLLRLLSKPLHKLNQKLQLSHWLTQSLPLFQQRQPKRQWLILELHSRNSRGRARRTETRTRTRTRRTLMPLKKTQLTNQLKKKKLQLKISVQWRWKPELWMLQEDFQSSQINQLFHLVLPHLRIQKPEEEDCSSRTSKIIQLLEEDNFLVFLNLMSKEMLWISLSSLRLIKKPIQLVTT